MTGVVIYLSSHVEQIIEKFNMPNVNEAGIRISESQELEVSAPRVSGYSELRCASLN